MSDYCFNYSPHSTPSARTSTSSTYIPSEHLERSKALREARDTITGDRQNQYGDPATNFQRIADVWNVLVPRPEKPWSKGDVALALIGLKVARAAQGYTRDTYIDIAGYAALAVELNEMEDE